MFILTGLRNNLTALYLLKTATAEHKSSLEFFEALIRRNIQKPQENCQNEKGCLNFA